MYTINNINSQFDLQNLDNTIYIVVHNPLDVPPHLLLFCNNKYYSLSAKKSVVDGDAHKLINRFIAKKTPLLFIQLKTKDTAYSLASIAQHFMEYQYAGEKNSTCLTPIKKAISEIYTCNTSNINFIYELIPFLEELNLVESKSHLFLDTELNNNSFHLKTYTNKDILNKIEHYQTKSNYGSTYTN